MSGGVGRELLQQGMRENVKAEGPRANGTTSHERLLRFLSATAEQQAAIDRILVGKVERPMVGGQEGAATVVAEAEPFITKAETAKRLNRDVRTITTWMRVGLIPYYKIAHTVVFKWSEVEKQLAATCRVAPPQV
jgi:hypothetical protein